MSLPEQTPIPLNLCSLSELEERSRRSEHFMNLALERRQWSAVRYHRADMLAVQREFSERLNNDPDLADATSAAG